MVKVEAYHDGERWCARGLGVDIFTQGSSFEELIANLREAVALHFEGSAQVPDVLILSEVKVADATAAAG
jgi:hypothetical protein